MEPARCSLSNVIAIMLALSVNGAVAQSVGPSGGTGICTDHSGRNFPCGGGGGGPRGPTQTEILNTELYNLLKRLVRDTDLRWGDIPKLEWGTSLRSVAALSDMAFAGTRRRYYFEQRRRSAAEGNLRAARAAAGTASAALRDASTHLAIERNRRDAAQNRFDTQRKLLVSLERALDERRASIVRVEISTDEIRNRFYARARKIKFLPQKPSAYRTALTPPSPVYGRPRIFSRATAAARARIGPSARAQPAARAAAADPSNSFPPTRADARSIRNRFKEIEKTARSIRVTRGAADRAVTATRQLTGAAESRRSGARQASRQTDTMRDNADRLEKQIAGLHGKVKRTREWLREVDDGLLKSIVEWAAWQELDRRLQSAVDQLTVTRIIDLSGVNKVRDVMKDAVTLSEDIFKVLRETPRALVHEQAAIPRLERDIDEAVRKFNVSFQSNLTGMPDWLTRKISRHTRQ